MYEWSIGLGVEEEKRPVGIYPQVHEIQFKDDWWGRRVG